MQKESLPCNGTALQFTLSSSGISFTYLTLISYTVALTLQQKCSVYSFIEYNNLHQALMASALHPYVFCPSILLP